MAWCIHKRETFKCHACKIDAPLLAQEGFPTPPEVIYWTFSYGQVKAQLGLISIAEFSYDSAGRALPDETKARKEWLERRAKYYELQRLLEG
jgi:hypothetical protein